MSIAHCRTRGVLRRGVISALALAVMATTVQMGTTAQATVQDEAVTPVPSGLSTDSEAIAEAADNYSKGDAGGVTALVSAASATEALDLEQTGRSVSAETSDGGEVMVSPQGEVTLVSPESLTVGLVVAGDASNMTVVDGAVVQTQVTPSTDVVTRATESGVQIVGVFGDSDASGELTVPMTLPEGSTLVPAGDGSLKVLAEVVTEILAPGEEERVDAALGTLLGDVVEVDGEVMLTDEQLAAVAAIEPETVEVTQVRQVATVDAPWAVDANGVPVATRFEVDGNVITQVVDLDEATAFPVTADPSWWWWTKKATGCVASAGALIGGAVALAAKVHNALKASKAGTKLRSAYKMWLKFGNNNRDRLVNLLLSFQTFGGLVLKHGVSQGLKTFKSKKVGVAATGAGVIAFVQNASGLLTDILGLGSCVSLITGKD